MPYVKDTLDTIPFVLFVLHFNEVLITVRCLFVCLCILHQSCLTITAGTANCPILGELDSSLDLLWRELGSNVPEGDSTQNTEPPFIA